LRQRHAEARMEKRPKLTSEGRQEIIDAFIAEATNNLFYGDFRDGTAPAINLENFINEMIRMGPRHLGRDCCSFPMRN
jgi:hypothetical protein